MSTDTAARIAVTVRLEPVLHRQLRDAARLSFRPLSREIAFRLAESLEAKQPPGTSGRRPSSRA
jgi:hypothetical protein